MLTVIGVCVRFGLGDSISGALLILRNVALIGGCGRLCGCMGIVMLLMDWSFRHV
nr:MAG TPA: hypothetical protein [Caudoviricetes sp.]